MASTDQGREVEAIETHSTLSHAATKVTHELSSLAYHRRPVDLGEGPEARIIRSGSAVDRRVPGPPEAFQFLAIGTSKTRPSAFEVAFHLRRHCRSRVTKERRRKGKVVVSVPVGRW